MITDQPGGEPLRAFIVSNGSRREFKRYDRLHRAGDRLGNVYLLEIGWIARVRTDRNGIAAFTALHIANEVVGADALSGFAVADDLTALTSVRLLQVPLAALQAGAAADASLALILASLLAKETVFLREALFAVGRQPGTSRLCTFFIQTFERLVAAGLADPTAKCFDLPLTQADLATATGLTSVHVNRVLKQLREWEWLEFRNGKVHLLNLKELKQDAQVAQFTP